MSLQLIMANHPPSFLLGDSPFTSIDIYYGYKCILEETKSENNMLTWLIHIGATSTKSVSVVDLGQKVEYEHENGLMQ